MRSISAELKARLQAVEEERGKMQRRLQTLEEIERALKLLIAEEELQLHGSQLSLIPVGSANGRCLVGRTPLSKFLIEVMADGAARPLKTLADLGISRGLDFQAKNPLRVLHFALVGLQKNGYAHMVSPSVWELTPNALPQNRYKPEQASPEQGKNVE